MDDEKLRSEAQETPERETSGQYLWRVLKPVGCIAVLLLFVMYLVLCFTVRFNPDGAKDAPAQTPTEQTEPAQN